MPRVEFCGGVHTAQKQRSMQISIGFCTHFIGISMVLVSVLGSVNEPLGLLTPKIIFVGIEERTKITKEHTGSDTIDQKAVCFNRFLNIFFH